MLHTGQRKFQEGDRVMVNETAIGDSWFVGKKGYVEDYHSECYGVSFPLPGNPARVEYRRLKQTKLDLVTSKRRIRR